MGLSIIQRDCIHTKASNKLVEAVVGIPVEAAGSFAAVGNPEVADSFAAGTGLGAEAKK